jgi:hypothetical protein
MASNERRLFGVKLEDCGRGLCAEIICGLGVALWILIFILIGVFWDSIVGVVPFIIFWVVAGLPSSIFACQFIFALAVGCILGWIHIRSMPCTCCTCCQKEEEYPPPQIVVGAKAPTIPASTEIRQAGSDTGGPKEVGVHV